MGDERLTEGSIYDINVAYEQVMCNLKTRLSGASFQDFRKFLLKQKTGAGRKSIVELAPKM